ncbi:MAG: type II secretion system protein [Clostridia bacterium]|nr:type II secretion system protein [Clostridia bacterium]
MKHNKGFSIVELIVVIAVMAILAAIAIPTFSIFITKARESTDIQYMHDVEHMLKLAYADDPTIEITEITVYVNRESGYVENISYTIDGGWEGEIKVADHVFVHQEGDGENVSPLIDWEYSFKAWKTVTENPNWQTNWTLECNKLPENQVVPEQSGQNPPVDDIPDYRQ